MYIATSTCNRIRSCTTILRLSAVLAILLLPYCSSFAQHHPPRIPPVDTRHIPHHDSIEVQLSEKDTIGSKLLDDIEKEAKKTGFTNFISRALFVKEPATSHSDSSFVKEVYEKYDGKIIRTITATGLKPFEESEHFPDGTESNWLNKLANGTHVRTRGYVLKNNLMFSEGDRFSVQLLMANIAYLRSLPFVFDALASITETSPDSDSIDVNMVVRDVWSIGVDVRRVSLRSNRISIYDRNILGLGVELRLNLVYERNAVNKYEFGYGIEQEIANIKGTFITSRVEWANTPTKRIRHASFNRNILAQLKTVGGISYNDVEEDRYFITIDTLHRLRTLNQEIWGGHVFNISHADGSGQRLAILSRFAHQSLRSKLPESDKPIYYPFERSNLYIGSISLFRQRYHTDRLIFGFGVHESIPYGYNATLQAGYENHAYNQRFYSSASYFYGWQHRWGYILAGGGIYGYLNKGTIEQGILDAKISYFTPLIPLKRQAYRQFFYVHYSRGINRTEGEGEVVNLLDDIRFNRGTNDKRLFGTNRLVISGETDIFTTLKVIGFRIVIFNFIDAMWIGNHSAIFANSYFFGTGFGVRLRNDKLVFRAIQIKFGWYPRLSQSSFSDYRIFSAVDRFAGYSFIPLKPEIKTFQ